MRLCLRLCGSGSEDRIWICHVHTQVAFRDELGGGREQPWRWGPASQACIILLIVSASENGLGQRREGLKLESTLRSCQTRAHLPRCIMQCRQCLTRSLLPTPFPHLTSFPSPFRLSSSFTQLVSHAHFESCSACPGLLLQFVPHVLFTDRCTSTASSAHELEKVDEASSQ